ncbi:MAG: hypothetical protein FJW31_20710 [Acidobacteria bacterium]|nr:hypothetical protein [Acidobacteriota bacterium]
MLDKTLVSTLQSTAESVMGTVETLRTPASAPDTLAALEKQRKILQERKLIVEMERALEQLLRPAGQQ